MNKNDLRVRRTRMSLENSLITLLQTKRLNKVQVSELTDMAMVSRKTFYKHFDNVDELFVYTVANHFNKLNTQVIEEIQLMNSVSNEEKNEILCKRYFNDLEVLKIIMSVKRRELIMEGLRRAIKKWIKHVVPDWKFVNEDHEIEMIAGALLASHTKLIKEGKNPNINEMIKVNENFVKLYSRLP